MVALINIPPLTLCSAGPRYSTLNFFSVAVMGGLLYISGRSFTHVPVLLLQYTAPASTILGSGLFWRIRSNFAMALSMRYLHGCWITPSLNYQTARNSNG